MSTITHLSQSFPTESISPATTPSEEDINLEAPCVLYIRIGISLLSRERFLYI